MSRIIVIALIAICGRNCLGGPEGAWHWAFDHPTVMVGGCNAICFDKSAKDLPRNLKLRMPGKPDMSLRRACTWLEADNGSICHVWINIDDMEPVPGNPSQRRPRPVWDKAGQVEVTLVTDEQEYGSKVVTVVSLTEEAKPALALLYPVSDKNKRVSAQDIAWLDALTRPYIGLDRREDNALQFLETSLAAICKHPDWARVAPAILRHRQLQEQMRLARVGGSAAVASMEWRQRTRPLIEGVKQSQEASAFGKAVRNVGLRWVLEIESKRGVFTDFVPTTLPAQSQPS